MRHIGTVKFSHSYGVKKEDISEKAQEVLAWVKKHCRSFFRCEGRYSWENTWYDFYFTDEADVTLFNLKFGGQNA